jgi:hypothetical protein
VPLGAEFDVGLAGGRLTVIPVTRDGARLPPAAIEQRGGKAWFRTARDALRYELSR